ncbi:winged helix-turn-helix domain-containing protein [Methanolobus mangrovi]|uniref:Winged helix-turn-helix domain-containing protein n=1 Tax=Methanolobus mangrovi TaxID=3072977 RepID=A0AA51UH12_9EURY|nr:winged helix-turn-helix domain-containing protein [Methanolobus mangrovi]WMW23031.1 winged helix-turn-helix domain-containing protein [Methanolobus mangrovi]
MKTELISTVFLSEKRKNTLIMLMDGPATIDDIKKSINGTTSAIMAQVKILIEQGLIEQKDDEYRLTHIGRIILKKIKPLIEALNVVEDNKDFWESRDLGAVPDPLLDRIGDLGEIMIHEPDLNHLFEPPKELLTSLKQTKNVCTFYSYFCPTCPYNYAELAKKEVNYNLILTRPVYERLRDEYTEQYNAIMNSQNSHLFVCEEDIIKPGAISVTDNLLLLSFFNKKGLFDHKKVISFHKSARQWGQDFFYHYRQLAEQVK